MRVRTPWTAAGGAILLTLLALAPRTAAAQLNPFDRPDAPALVHNFGGGTVRELEREFQYDLHVMGAFAGKRRLDRFDQNAIERAQPWKFYGRLGPMHFHDELDGKAGLQFSLRRQGPSLGTRVYIGIHKTF